MTTHALAIPAPLDALRTWCGMTPANAPCDDRLASDASTVDCPECIRRGRIALRYLERLPEEAAQ